MPPMNSLEEKIGETPSEHTMTLHPDTVHLVDLVHLAKEMLTMGTLCRVLDQNQGMTGLLDMKLG
jgi:hypothetical protein